MANAPPLRLALRRASCRRECPRRAREPAAQKSAGPARHGAIVPEPPFEMAMARVGAGFAHALAGQEHPVAHHRESHFRMELEAVGLPAIAEGLRRAMLGEWS